MARIRHAWESCVSSFLVWGHTDYKSLLLRWKQRLCMCDFIIFGSLYSCPFLFLVCSHYMEFISIIIVPPRSVVSRVLEVTDLPEGITRPEAEKLFNQLSLCGAKIQWLKEPQGGRGGAGGCGPCPGAGPSGPGATAGPGASMGAGGAKGDGNDPAHLYTVVAVFPNTMAAQSASFKLNNSGASLFKLRAAKKNYDLRVLERASSQWEEKRGGGTKVKDRQKERHLLEWWKRGRTEGDCS